MRLIRKKTAISFLFWLCTYYLLPLSISSVAADDHLTVELNTTGMPPLNTPDQKGFMDLIALAAFSRIGVTLKTVQLPAERGLLDANAGYEDGEMSRIAGLSEKYTHLIQVREKIMDWEFMAFSARLSDMQAGWSGLASQSTAIITGWKILENNVPPTAQLTKVKFPYQLFHLLQQNRVDLVLYERWGGLTLLKHQKKIKLLEPPLAVKAMYIYLHEKHWALVPRLEQALRSVKQDGTYASIYNKILAPLARR